MKFFKIYVQTTDYDYHAEQNILFTADRHTAEYVYDMMVDSFELTMVMGGDIECAVPLFNAHNYRMGITYINMTQYIMDDDNANGEVCFTYNNCHELFESPNLLGCDGEWVSVYDCGCHCPIASIYGSVDNYDNYTMDMDMLLNPSKYEEWKSII